MREFRKTPRKSFWRKLWDFIISFANAGRIQGHDDRMSKRRRKSRFDKW